MSTNRGTEKDVVYRRATEYYSAINRNEIKPFETTYKNPEIIILRKTNIMISLICGIFKKKTKPEKYK